MEITEEQIEFPAAGQRLEGILAYPIVGTPTASLLVLPPHPHLGGNMANNVVRHLARRAAEDGCASLRFNYHGVGKSTIDLPPNLSPFDHWQAMEQKRSYTELVPDAVEAYAYLQRTCGSPPRRVVAGYSLGAALAGMMLPHVDATHVTAVSHPTARISLDAFIPLRIPKLFIAGDQDFAFDPERFQQEFAQLPDPKRFIHLTGCDHFFRKQEERVYTPLARTLASNQTTAR